jgi:hypothetical protein
MLLFCLSTSLVNNAAAQDVEFDVTGTYSASAQSTALTAPGEAFDYRFTLPQTAVINAPTNQPLYFNIPVLSGSYTINGLTSVASDGSFTYAESGGNLESFNLNFAEGSIGTGAPLPDFPQLFSVSSDYSSVQFLTGTYIPSFAYFLGTLVDGSSFVAETDYPKIVGTAAIPESSPIALTLLGLVAIGILARRRFHHFCPSWGG